MLKKFGIYPSTEVSDHKSTLSTSTTTSSSLEQRSLPRIPLPSLVKDVGRRSEPESKRIKKIPYSKLRMGLDRRDSMSSSPHGSAPRGVMESFAASGRTFILDEGGSRSRSASKPTNMLREDIQLPTVEVRDYTGVIPSLMAINAATSVTTPNIVSTSRPWVSGERLARLRPVVHAWGAQLPSESITSDKKEQDASIVIPSYSSAEVAQKSSPTKM